nr:prolyl oligopeptidase family serine peptidase [Nannocystis sp. ILAH1]
MSVNFRASNGFTKRHLNAGDHEWAGKMHDDLLDAVAWANDKKISDPARVAIMGASYGGYATLVGLTFTPDVFACGVDVVGPSNLETLLRSVPPYWAAKAARFAARVGDVGTEEGRALLHERSPLHRVDKIARPRRGPRLPAARQRDLVQRGHRGVPRPLPRRLLSADRRRFQRWCEHRGQSRRGARAGPRRGAAGPRYVIHRLAQPRAGEARIRGHRTAHARERRPRHELAAKEPLVRGSSSNPCSTRKISHEATWALRGLNVRQTCYVCAQQ